tara:strand:+ start:1430 stop:2284 length:855 start_codon:yes stop_codon:yes gene_type:complete
MKLYTIETGYFKLDGGAMFGVVPKSLWQRTNPADENNLCTWAMRSLLVEYDNKLILIDTGIGNKQSDKFFKNYHLHGDDSLQKSINSLGYSHNEITDVILTHLHFDHCGGSVVFNKEINDYEVAFTNANYWTSEKHWDWATNPNSREKASFLKENILPIKKSGRLNLIQGEGKLFKNISVFFANGHTESQTIPIIEYKEKKIVFMADLLPSVGHIPLAYVMGYDTRPLITLDEKRKFLNEAADKNYILFLQHDPNVECCTVKHTDKGVRVNQKFTLSDFLRNKI